MPDGKETDLERAIREAAEAAIRAAGGGQDIPPAPTTGGEKPAGNAYLGSDGHTYQDFEIDGRYSGTLDYTTGERQSTRPAPPAPAAPRPAPGARTPTSPKPQGAVTLDELKAANAYIPPAGGVAYANGNVYRELSDGSWSYSRAQTKAEMATVGRLQRAQQPGNRPLPIPSNLPLLTGADIAAAAETAGVQPGEIMGVLRGMGVNLEDPLLRTGIPLTRSGVYEGGGAGYIEPGLTANARNVAEFRGYTPQTENYVPGVAGAPERSIGYTERVSGLGGVLSAFGERSTGDALKDFARAQDLQRQVAESMAAGASRNEAVTEVRNRVTLQAAQERYPSRNYSGIDYAGRPIGDVGYAHYTPFHIAHPQVVGRTAYSNNYVVEYPDTGQGTYRRTYTPEEYAAEIKRIDDLNRRYGRDDNRYAGGEVASSVGSVAGTGGGGGAGGLGAALGGGGLGAAALPARLGTDALAAVAAGLRGGREPPALDQPLIDEITEEERRRLEAEARGGGMAIMGRGGSVITRRPAAVVDMTTGDPLAVISERGQRERLTFPRPGRMNVAPIQQGYESLPSPGGKYPIIKPEPIFPPVGRMDVAPMAEGGSVTANDRPNPWVPERPPWQRERPPWQRERPPWDGGGGWGDGNWGGSGRGRGGWGGGDDDGRDETDYMVELDALAEAAAKQQRANTAYIREGWAGLAPERIMTIPYPESLFEKKSRYSSGGEGLPIPALPFYPGIRFQYPDYASQVLAEREKINQLSSLARQDATDPGSAYRRLLERYLRIRSPSPPLPMTAAQDPMAVIAAVGRRRR